VSNGAADEPVVPGILRAHASGNADNQVISWKAGVVLRVDRSDRALKRLDRLPLPEVGLKERHDIQQMIVQSPEEFFAEMGETLLLIGEEVRPTDVVDDRIDLLAVDRDGAVVVMELKRGTNKLQLLQALSYASMVAGWDKSQLVDERCRFVKKPSEEVEEELEEFLDGDLSSLNQSQRMILLAGDYDYEVLSTAEWLTEVYEVDIRCFRLGLFVEGESEYLTCTCIYPPPELADVARRRGAGRKRALRWADWDAALEGVQNPAVVTYFRSELERGCVSYLRRRQLHYSINGRQRFFVAARKERAYVWQHGRFAGDQQYWTRQLGKHADIMPKKGGARLRFYLTTDKDFNAFKRAVQEDIPSVEFSKMDPSPADESGEEGGGDDDE